MSVKLAVVGGFLGAGKTSLIATLARYLQQQGERVAVITNDQGGELIDTRIMNAANVLARDIKGGCYCCKFHEFSNMLHLVTREYQPSWILAEAVGSCTDLVATVLRPMHRRHAQDFDLSPLTVVVDPVRAHAIVGSTGVGISGFSTEIDYLYRQQVEEAQIVLVNKADVTRAALSDAVQAQLRNLNSNAGMIRTSAVDSTGIQTWLTHLHNSAQVFQTSALDGLDYDTYAQAEAQLGWVNLSARLLSDNSFSLAKVVQCISDHAHQQLKMEGYQVAHIKIMGLSSTQLINGSLTKSDGEWQWQLGRATDATEREGTMIVNARVFAPPDVISKMVLNSLNVVSRDHGVDCKVLTQEAFRPSAPSPVFRDLQAT